MQLSLRLPREDPRDQVQPVRERGEPMVWIRRLRVADDLATGDEHIVREIELRRGLNVVWAPPQTPGGDNALFGDGMAGHTAGKTTLCRLIRHLLGEATLASEATRRRIRQAFPTGWLLGEVVVGGALWAVARPLYLGPRPFCVQGGLDDLFSAEGRLDFQRLVDAIEAVSTAVLPAREFPTRTGTVGWEHLLPWLTRDQECRFADFLEWRHPSSDSQAPALTSDERQFVVRSVLGLLSDDERLEQARNASLVADKATATARAPLLAHQATVDHARVERILGQEFPPPSDQLFGQQARRELDARRDDLAKRLATLDAADLRTTLQAALEAAVATETSAKRDLAEAEERWTLEQSALRQLDPDVPASEQDEGLFSGLPPARGYCNVPMDLARERGCPLATTRPFELDEQRAQRTAGIELTNQRAVVEALAARVERYGGELADAKSATTAARAALLRASTDHQERLSVLLRGQAALDQAERLVDNAEQASRDSASLAQRVTAFDDRIKESYARQEELRRATSDALTRFSARFDYVVRALVGDEVTASVEGSGRSLKLVADQHGDRDSAAFGTVKLLAFDLAALTQSIEGRGFHPRFLLHDGPREADLAEDIYERLFLYARRLEACFEGESGFQYIITTTTPPPAELRGEPWLRLELHGAPANERLLRRDL